MLSVSELQVDLVTIMKTVYLVSKLCLFIYLFIYLF